MATLSKTIARLRRKLTTSGASETSLGDAARDRKSWTAAAEHYRRHLETAPDDFGIWVQLGHSLKESGDLDAADAAYASAEALNAKDADLALNRGHLARKQGDTARALTFYRQAAKLDKVGKIADEVLALVSDLTKRNTPATPVQSTAHGTQSGSVDFVEGDTVTGWVYDTATSGTPAEPVVEIVKNGKVIATGKASLFRHDVVSAGLGKGKTGFSIALKGKAKLGDEITARIKDSGFILNNCPAKVSLPAHVKSFLNRNSHLTKTELLIQEQRAAQETAGSKLSIIMPCYNTKPEWLERAIDSVLDQWCPNWELICIDDASPDSHVLEQLNAYAQTDNRIKVIASGENQGISKAVNKGIVSATGDYIAFLDHDDMIEPEAVYRMLDAARSGATLIYSDEAITTDDLDEIRTFGVRPAFSHEYYLGHPYFVHFVAVRADIARQLGGYDETMKISADVDFVLRAIEASETVAHVPAVLYRWRTHSKSTGHARANEGTKATITALNNHLRRIGSQGKAVKGERFNTFRINYPDEGGRTLVIIPTKDRIDLLKMCLESLWKTTSPDDLDIVVIDHDSKEAASRRYFASISDRVTIYPYSGPFNFAQMNNHAFRDCWKGQKFVLFLNNDIEAIESGWLERMRSLAGRPEVGAVGATLLFGDGRVQHAGVVIGIGGAADHSHKFGEFIQDGERAMGFNCSLVATRDYSAVTAACLMMRAEIFDGITGYDENLAIGFNDTDLCLRISSMGYAVLNDAFSVLNHHESATRSKTNQIDHPRDGSTFMRQWRDMISAGDPFYSPLLANGPDHVYSNLDIMTHAARVRPVSPKLKPLEEGRPRFTAPHLKHHF